MFLKRAKPASLTTNYVLVVLVFIYLSGILNNLALTLIQQHEKDNPGSLMNSKSEYGKGKLVRFEMATRRT